MSSVQRLQLSVLLQLMWLLVHGPQAFVTHPTKLENTQRLHQTRRQQPPEQLIYHPRPEPSRGCNCCSWVKGRWGSNCPWRSKHPTAGRSQRRGQDQR